MDLRATLPVRLLRAGVLAAVVLLAGSVAHVSAAGRLPGPAGMLTLYLVATAACAAVLGREASTLRLVGLTVGGQLVVHSALSAVAGHAGDASRGDAGHAHGAHGAPSAAGGLAAHAHHGEVPSSAGSGLHVPEWVTHGLGDVVAHPAMAAAHVAAAVAVGLWLAVGERALWTLLRLARCTAREVLARALIALGLHPLVLRAVPRPVGVRAVATDPVPLLPVWSRGPARRGPPVALLPH